MSAITVLCTKHNFQVYDRVNLVLFIPPGEVTFLPQLLTGGMSIHFRKIHSVVYRPQHCHLYHDQHPHVMSYQYTFAKSHLLVLEHTAHGPSMKES